MSPKSRLLKAADFFALRRSIVGLLAMVILVGLGERLAGRFLSIYILALGGGFVSVGGLNGLTNLVSAVYSYAGGYLSDRLGAKRALLLFNVLAMIGYLIVILIPAWQAVLVGAIFFMAWSAISLPATMGIVSKAVPNHKRAMGVSMHSMIRRIPMALGPVIGGIFIDLWGLQSGVRLAFGVALVMAVVSCILQQRLIERGAAHEKDGESRVRAEMNPFKLWREMGGDLRSLLISDILIRFCEQIPDVFVAVWCMNTIVHPVSATEFGLLSTIEMATAVLVYVPVAHFADRMGKKPFVAATFIFFTLFPLVLYFCDSFWLLVGAFVLRGLKEFGEPTRKALIMDLAPENRKAAMFGLYYLLRDIPVAAAAFSGGLLWKLGPEANLLTAFGFGILGTLWFFVRGRDLPLSDSSKA
ncbi:MAG: MFS transporter [Candidatus Hydrogenedentes bacterium]|nr:MFS transporter [Candidatus Hydrogenedentota bacterium]